MRNEPVLVARAERLAADLDELRAVLPRHYAELSEHRAHGYALDPEYNAYLALEASGQLLYVTLRWTDSGELAGYFVGFPMRDLHYRAMSLKMDILYVVPEARGNGGGMVLMHEVEAEAERRGVDLKLMNFKESHREFMERMLRACGYAPFEAIWAKWASPLTSRA